MYVCQTHVVDYEIVDMPETKIDLIIFVHLSVTHYNIRFKVTQEIRVEKADPMTD